MFEEVTATQAAKNVQQTNELKVTIATPKEQRSLTANPSVKIAGATKRNAVVVVTGGKNPIARSVNTDGSFAPDVELTEGINNLLIHVYDQNGNKTETARTVVYLKDAIAAGSTITTGMFKLEDDTPQLIVNEQSNEIKTTKQSKLYQFVKGVKKSLRNISLFSTEYPVYLVQEKDNPENTLAVLQQTDNQTQTLIVYGKITDKSVVEEDFTFGVSPLDKSETTKLLVNTTTKVFKAESETELLRGTEIKIGDKVVAIISDLETGEASQVLIIPGQAAGILKDVKQD